MMKFLLSVLIVFIETYSFDLLYGLFFNSKGFKWYVRIPILFVLNMAGALSMYLIGTWKIALILVMLIIYCKTIYDSSWWQSGFVSGFCYLYVFLTDSLFLMLAYTMGFDVVQDYSVISVLSVLSPVAYAVIVLCFRKLFPQRKRIGLFDGKEWIPFTVIPVISLACYLYLYNEFLQGGFRKGQGYAAIVLYVINLAMFYILLRTLRDKEDLRVASVKENDIKSRLDYFHDMQKVYERQGKKLHDYKNQLQTMQELIKSGDTDKALHFAEGLTESISVEMSAVNTNNSVINAVLNQKYRTAGSRGIKMIFTVGDLSRIRLIEEEIVIIFSNLLDNAIHECERIVAGGNKAVISVKAVFEDGQFELYVKNPVMARVEISDGQVVTAVEEGHGIGLTNVRDVVEKYDGSFALACDDKEFIVAVIISF